MATVVKEGWLQKKGEFIQSWRSRYFVLKSDGTFRGFKTKPAALTDQPINFFDVYNSSVQRDDTQVKKGKWGFRIKFMQVNRIIDRSFHLDTEVERTEWLEAYASVKAGGGGGAGGGAGADRPVSQVSALSAASGRSRAFTFIGGAPQPIEMGVADFEMLKVLGKGTFGKVMLAKQIKTGDVFAIKILKKAMVLEKDELAHTLTENSVLATCNHPFLTELRYSFQTDDLLAFVLEYVNGGEIFFHLSKDRRFSENRARFYIAEITSAMTYLHGRGIIYRDLKLENLMLDRFGHIKITDFGLCKENIGHGDATSTFCGTPEYLAPEVIEDSDYGRSVDWWGVGVVLYEMISGMLPFRSRDHEELFGLILSQPLKVPAFFSADAKDAVTKLLMKNPEERLGSGPDDGKEIMAHPFFASIDWAKLDAKQLEVPFVPTVTSEVDVANFDPYFTQEEAKITPPDAPTPATSAEAKAAAFKDFKSVGP